MWRGALKAADSSQHPRRFLPQCVLFFFSWESVSSLQPCGGATTNGHSTRNLDLNLPSSYSCSQYRNTVPAFAIAPSWLRRGTWTRTHVGWSEFRWILTVCTRPSFNVLQLKHSSHPPPKNERSCPGHMNCVSPPHQQKAFHILTSGGIQFCRSCFSHQQGDFVVSN